MNIPSHIAIIPDGNRRWAKEKGMPTLAGHKKGFDRTKEIINYSQEIGVKAVTFYAFSTENWNRAKDEVDYLMDLFMMFFDKYMSDFHRLGMKFVHIGDTDKLPKKCVEKIRAGMELTKDNKGLIIQLALNYGGRDEIKRAVQKIVEDGVKPEDVTEELIESHFDTAGTPNPDMLIRTSGEQRISGFMLWQAAYAELYFTNIYWPDFGKKELDIAIEEFNSRQRRFGS